MTGRRAIRRTGVLAAMVAIGLVSGGAATEAQSRAAQVVREATAAPGKATDADVERLMRALEGDPLLSAGIALQDLANGRRELDAGTLDPFLKLAGYSPERQSNGCQHIQVPYQSGQGTVHLTVLPAERLLTMGIVIRDFPTDAAGAAVARALSSRTLPGAGRFDYDGRRLMIVHSFDLKGLSTGAFQRGLGQVMARIAASQPIWLAEVATRR
jgi:hypothetical protein